LYRGQIQKQTLHTQAFDWTEQESGRQQSGAPEDQAGRNEGNAAAGRCAAGDSRVRSADARR
jgi:hypothetical protein